MVRGCERGDFRVVQYSLRANHVHPLVEAADAGALARGMIAVGSRLARAVHRVFRRSGQVLAARYHGRAVKTPRKVHHALRYVLLNARRHTRRPTGPAFGAPGAAEEG
jgi:REP element-mobilizing transposase RayT